MNRALQRGFSDEIDHKVHRNLGTRIDAIIALRVNDGSSPNVTYPSFCSHASLHALL